MREKPEVDDRTQWWWDSFFITVIDHTGMEESKIIYKDAMNNHFVRFESLCPLRVRTYYRQ